jgi:O-antigen biosynthesis protein
MIDIVIPTKGKIDYLFKCLLSIINKTVNTRYHIYVCDTGSTADELSAIQKFLKKNFAEKKNVSLVQFNFYNFAKINNIVVGTYSKNPVVLFCNNDIELIDNCIDRMYDVLTSGKDVGTVGCRLLFEDGTVQHAGQVAFIRAKDSNNDQSICVTHRGLGSRNRYKSEESVLGNTAGFMMVSKDVFTEAGMFSEKYNECFEDVELNIQILINGRDNRYIDDVSATHYESITRTKTPVALKRMAVDFEHNLQGFLQGVVRDPNTPKSVHRLLGYN